MPVNAENARLGRGEAQRRHAAQKTLLVEYL